MKRLITAAIASLIVLVAPLGAHADATYGPSSYADGPKGGDRWNHVSVDRASGRITIVRANPQPGAFNCAGTGGFASFEVAHTAGAGDSVVVVFYDETVLDPFTWIQVLVTGANGRWLGSEQVRGPLLLDGAVEVPLESAVAPGEPVRILFGLQVASACPNVDGGTARFTQVSIG